MNYIREINAFYDWLETNRLSLSAIALWHGLMHINNKAAWTDEFAVAISVLCAKTGLSPRGVNDARNELKLKGRITWQSRKGNQSAAYRIIPLLQDLSANIAHNDTDNHADKCADSSADNHAALNKLKRNETKPETSTPPSLPDMTQTEREILNQLKNIKGYPFDHQTDLTHIRGLAIEFTCVDILAEAKKYATWTLDKPLKVKANPRLQFRNWVERAGKGFKAIDGGNNQRGGETSGKHSDLFL